MKNHNFQSAIEALQACTDACLHCMNACMEERNPAMFARCIQLDRECAAFCSFAVLALASGNSFSKKIAALCAEICTACADECDKHAHMAHCKACAKACRKCATECSIIGEVSRLEVA